MEKPPRYVAKEVFITHDDNGGIERLVRNSEITKKRWRALIRAKQSAIEYHLANQTSEPWGPEESSRLACRQDGGHFIVPDKLAGNLDFQVITKYSPKK